MYIICDLYYECILLTEFLIYLLTSCNPEGLSWPKSHQRVPCPHGGVSSSLPGNHRLMGNDRRKPLVIKIYGNGGHGLAPAVDELHDTLQILARRAVWLRWTPDDNALDILFGYIVLEIVEERRRTDRRQSVGNNLQRIGDG